MTPPDHEPSLVALPAGHRQSLVLVTSDRLRHLRLGYLMQQRFPGLLTAWFTAPETAPEPAAGGLGGRLASTTSGAAVIAKLKRGEVAEVAAMVRRRLTASNLRKVKRQWQRGATASADRLLAQAEQEMFAHEIERLSGQATLRPTAEPTPANFADAVRRTRPYFLVVHGAAVPPDTVRHVTGVALTQHDGWLGSLDGPHAVELALYLRRPSWVGSTTTAHVAGHADAALVRRSSATLHPDDSVAHCVAAAAAVGAGLMLDTIDEALHEQQLPLSPLSGGRTLVPADYSAVVQEAIARDFAAGWLADALAAEQDF